VNGRHVHGGSAEVDRHDCQQAVTDAGRLRLFAERPFGQDSHAPGIGVVSAIKMIGIRTLEDGEPFRPLVARFLIGDDVGLLPRDHLKNAFRLRIVFAQIDLDEAIARAGLFVCLCAGGPAEEIACGTDSRAESHDRKKQEHSRFTPHPGEKQGQG